MQDRTSANSTNPSCDARPDHTSCHSATANQVRLVLHTAAFWLMHGVRTAIPPTNPLATAEFATLRERLIKIGARVIEHIARIRIQLPTSCPEGALFRAVALGLMLGFGEAFLTGMLVTILVVYRRDWVVTFDDARWLAPRA